MFKILGFILKISFFSLFVLILGNWIRWDGKTISDQVKIQVSHAQRTNLGNVVRHWAEKMTYNAKNRLDIQIPTQPEQPSDADEISPTERQKLKFLIQELNRNRTKK